LVAFRYFVEGCHTGKVVIDMETSVNGHNVLEI
jgi:hypothetical protein